MCQTLQRRDGAGDHAPAEVARGLRHVTIRDARPDDAGALVQLLELLGYPANPAHVLERLDRDAASRVFVAEDGDDVIGLVATHVTPLLERDRPVCRITAIVVRDDVRKRGVGAALVTRVEARRTATAVTAPS